MSITHNKNLNPQSHLLINCISGISIKGECILLLLIFLITGLCNSSANCLFEIFSFLTALPEGFYGKIYRALKKVHADIYHILDF